jgi:glutamate racemase
VEILTLHDKMTMMNKYIDPQLPIGIFDSGVGGLSVLRAIQQLLPHENLLYVGDQAHIPYGPRPKAKIRDFAFEITSFLLKQGAKLIVVACNTASAAALVELRQNFPQMPFVGMEPAVKPAAETTHSGKVGVLATPTTFSGDLYASVVERFAKNVEIFQDTCPGLVESIESGDIQGDEPHQILKKALLPMLAEGIDTVVMGCTHYPFVIPLIQSITGPEVRIIDPAPAIARQTRRLLEHHHMLNSEPTPGKLRYFTSGLTERFSQILTELLGQTGPVEKVVWKEVLTLEDGPSTHPG